MTSLFSRTLLCLGISNYFGGSTCCSQVSCPSIKSSVRKKTLLDRVFNDLGANVSQKQACRRVPLVMRLTINKR